MADQPSELRIDYMRLSQLQKWPSNPKRHRVDAISRSVAEFGYVEPITIDESTGRLVAGHGRLESLTAMKAAGAPPPARVKADGFGDWLVPVLRGVAFKDEAAAERYLLASNRLVELGGWDTDALREMTARIDDDRFLEDVGLTDKEMERLREAGADAAEAAKPEPEEVKEDETPAVAAGNIYVKPGDLWAMGRHRIICGDTTDPATVQRLVAGQVLSLVHADPPYGMGKEADGVANDNLYDSKLDEFQMRWWRAWAPALDPSGSAYIWGNAPDLWRLWWSGGGLSKEPELMVRNEIVWDKGAVPDMASDEMHSYPMATERCLFLMRGQQFLGNQNIADYWEGYEPLRSWLEKERVKAGWSNSDVNEVTGTMMAGHWFTKSQFYPISEKHYEVLQKAAAGRAFAEPYAALFERLFPGAKSGGNEYRRQLSAELRERRSFFDNAHEVMTDVWNFPRVTGEERHGHATPKPVLMMARVLKSSSNPSADVGVPFAGTCPEVIAAEQLGRRVYACELEPRYVQTVIERWAKFTGRQPEKLGVVGGVASP